MGGSPSRIATENVHVGAHRWKNATRHRNTTSQPRYVEVGFTVTSTMKNAPTTAVTGRLWLVGTETWRRGIYSQLGLHKVRG